MSDRQYMIIPASAVHMVDFSKVCQTSAETMFYSIDKTQTFVKWDGTMPDFLAEIPNAQGPYDGETMTAILATNAWSYGIPHV